MLLESVRDELVRRGLIGKNANAFGSPDELMLVSSGPISHQSHFSVLCGPSRSRVVIRQPSDIILPRSESHSPLSGDTRLEKGVLFVFQLEEWNGTDWVRKTSTSHSTLAEGLRQLCSAHESEFIGTEHDNLPFKNPFWAGALSYDLLQITQPLRLQYPPEENDLLCVLWQIERCIVHEKTSNEFIVLSIDEDWGRKTKLCLEEGIPEPVSICLKHADKPISNCTDEEHEAIVKTVQSAIVDGQLYQLNYGRSWEGEIGSEPWDVFRHSTSSNPAPYSGFLHMHDEGFALVSASPESLLSTRDQIITTAPIKGTAPRGASDAEELLLREDMISDRKERAEHRMLVDLMRNDVGRIAKPNQVWVERFDVETYAEVQHLVSRIKGRLKDDVDVFDAIENVFPGGSITGCPRTVVCAAIDELEKKPRSFWTGSMGWFDPSTGDSSWNILIRTAELHRKAESWHSRVTAGGGITIESNPKSEVAEAKWKANALLRSCGWLDDSPGPDAVKKLAIHPLPLENEQNTHHVSSMIHTESFRKDAVLLIDNLDSFTFNIAHSVCGLGHHVNIVSGRGEIQYSAQELLSDLQPSHIILGPGPGWPKDSPLTMEFAELSLDGETPPLLGICLGHQAIGVAAGLDLAPSPIGPVHGVPVKCLHNQQGLFEQLNEVLMTRYNSLTHLTSDVNNDSDLLIDATDDTKSLILGFHAKDVPVFGVQFHPESIGSQSGVHIISKFLEY